MGNARYIVGDVMEVLASLEPGSVDLVMTSPPFLALRSYLPADHPDKGKEIGSEATPGAFIDRMLDVVEACGRVLAPHGSLVFELGDTYAGTVAFDGTDGFAIDKGRGKMLMAGTGPVRNRKGNGWPLDKSKVLIPQLFTIALAYGFNPLTGRTTEPWRVRNTVAWCRPNPPVGRDGDKFRPATSMLTVACKRRDRYWDGDAVRTEALPGTNGTRNQVKRGEGDYRDESVRFGERVNANPAGAPLLDWWNIPTQPYKGAHYATFPADLVVPVVKSMCPLRVCRTCGQPSRRITEQETTRVIQGNNVKGTDDLSHRYPVRTDIEIRTLGWSDCGHDNWRPGLVLDPFAGSGTTLQVATGHGMDAIGIDLDSRNADLAVERIGGLFLSVETHALP